MMEEDEFQAQMMKKLTESALKTPVMNAMKRFILGGHQRAITTQARRMLLSQIVRNALQTQKPATRLKHLDKGTIKEFLMIIQRKITSID